MNAPFKSEAGRDAVRRAYREALEDWPVPAERRTVQTAFGETFVLISGPAQAPPVVLLHGSSANALTWITDAAVWTTEFRLYAIDQLGEPGLSATDRPALASADPSAWLGEVLAGLGLERVAIVGESLGGWFAVDYASRHPDRVTALTLLCPGGIGRQRREQILFALALLALGPRGRRASMRWLLGADIDTVPAWLIAVQQHFRPRMEPLPQVSDEALRGLTMPVLAVVGDRDHMFDSAATARRLAAAPRVSVAVLAGVGHLLPRQTTRVGQFLRSALAP